MDVFRPIRVYRADRDYVAPLSGDFRFKKGFHLHVIAVPDGPEVDNREPVALHEIRKRLLRQFSRSALRRSTMCVTFSP
jgi:hypothetical protein